MSDSEDLELDLEETGALGRGKTKKGSSASAAEKALKFLPRTGLLNEDGNIFYHDALTPTVPNEFLVRCKENGIHLKFGERFTDRERELIRANWETFARLAGLRPDEDALTVIGQGRNFGHIDPDVRSRLQSLKKQHKFWPLMCRGLEDRTANMVRYHMVVMFTPQPVAGFNAHLFMANPLDRSRFLRARQKFEDEKTKMSIYLNIAYKQVNSLYDLVFRMEDAVQGHVLVRMWGYISMCFNPNPKYRARAEKAFENGEKAFPAEWIKWGRLGFLVRRMPSLCKKTFEDVYPRVCDLMAKEDIDNMQAIRKISGCTLPRMQAHDFCAFVRIVLDLMTEQKKVTTSGHHIKYSRVDVEKEMERQGIHGFYTGRFTPFEYCRNRMVELIGAVKLHILPRIKIAYTVEDILLVAIRCLEDYCTMDGGKQAEAEMDDEGEKENDDEEEKSKTKGKGKTVKPRGLRVQTGDLVAHLFRFTREEKDKNFVPPWKFRRIVPERFAGVRSLFSDRHKEDYLVTMTSMLENKKVLRDSTDLKALLEMQGEEFEEEDDDEENDDKVEVKDVKEMQVPVRAKGDEFQLTVPKSAAGSSDYTIPIDVDAEKKAMNEMKRVDYKALARKRVEGKTIGTGYSTASDPEDLPTGDTTGDEDAVEVKKERRSNAHVEEEQIEMEQNEAGGDMEEEDEERLARKKDKMRRKNARKHANKKQRNSAGGDENSTASDGDTAAAETVSSNDKDAMETAEEKRLRLKKRKAERKSETRKRKQEEEKGNTTAAEEPSVKEEKTKEERKRLRSEKKKRQQQRKADRESMATGGETAGEERVEEQMDDGGGGDMMMMDDGIRDMGEVMMPSSPLEKKRREEDNAGDTQQQASTAETEEEERRRKKKEKRMQKIREMEQDDDGDIQTTVSVPVPVEETEEERKRRRKEERRQRRLAEQQAEGGAQTADQAEEERQRKRLERKRRRSGQLEMPAREEEGGWVCKRRKLEMEEAAEEAAASASGAPGTPAAAAKGGQVVERRTPYDKREKRERRKKVKCDCPDCR